MAEPPELWTFMLANLFIFGFGATLTTLSYWAYRKNDRKPSFRLSTIGFAVLTMGGVVEPIYQLGFKNDYMISGRELLGLQTIEGLFIAAGFGLLFYSIYIYDSDATKHVETIEHSPESP